MYFYGKNIIGFLILPDPLTDFMSEEPLFEEMLPGVDGVPGLPSFD